MTTKLVSTDVDGEGRYCPVCGDDKRASEISREFLAKGYYGHHDPCKKLQEWDDGFDPDTPCTCPPRHFSHWLGIEIQGKYDGISYYNCTSCNTTWDRWTREEVPDVF